MKPYQPVHRTLCDQSYPKSIFRCGFSQYIPEMPGNASCKMNRMYSGFRILPDISRKKFIKARFNQVS